MEIIPFNFFFVCCLISVWAVLYSLLSPSSSSFFYSLQLITKWEFCRKLGASTIGDYDYYCYYKDGVWRENTGPAASFLL